jgi:hypothetical protein
MQSFLVVEECPCSMPYPKDLVPAQMALPLSRTSVASGPEFQV